MRHIHSVHNTAIKEVARLRTRRGRKLQSRIIIDGIRETQRALAAGVEVSHIYVPETLADQPMDAELQQLLQADVDVTAVSEAVFRKIAFGDRVSSVVAVADVPACSLSTLELGSHPLVMVVESVEKPGNIGAIARTADAAAFDALLVADATTDVYNPNAIRASLGVIFGCRLAQATSDEVIDWLRARGIRIFAARVDAQVSYERQDYTQPTAIVVGNEADGLSAAWSGEAITPIKLPMLGISDSLNVSTTAAILMYEARRQRGC